MTTSATVTIPLQELDAMRGQIAQLEKQLEGEVYLPLEVTMARVSGAGCLAAWIEYKNINNVELASRTGFTKQYIGTLSKMQSLNDLKYSTVVTLAKGLGVKPAALLDDDEDETE
ncbi:hypothetical protein [Rheinheimera sp.]|uniref:hypothetical protein n=1 Tax=Rheinheimera sp. TaxID=1869214 RepID=UPI00307E8E78